MNVWTGPRVAHHLAWYSLTLDPPCIWSLKVPNLLDWALPLDPKWQLDPVLFFEWDWPPKADLVSYVWFLSGLNLSSFGRPALGKVHRGKFYLSDGFAHASGTYLPGPTLPGVEVWFFKVYPLLHPKVNFSLVS